MLLPPDGRALLTDLLRPPPGYSLDRAVATTFTLELDSLLAAPLAFAAHAIREAEDEPMSVMEAVHRCADRIDVFCQAGEIAVPKTESSLLLLLEEIVHPVRRPRPGRLFHPKMWLVRYAGGDVPLLRLVVLSRNLTKSRSWDVGLRLDGTLGPRADALNQPVKKLLQLGIDLAVTPLPAERRAAITQLLKDLGRAEWELPEGFRDIHFHALGIRGTIKPDFSGTRHLIISPFVQKAGLELCAPSPRPTIVGRQEALDSLPEEVLEGCTVFVLNDLAILDGDDEPDLMRRTGLHAKTYVVEHGQRAFVFMGSANATSAAFGGNVELLVELVGSRHEFGIDTVVGEKAPLRGLLEEYVRGENAEPDDEVGWALESYLLDLASERFHAAVVGRAEPYDLRVTAAAMPPPPAGASLRLSLLTRSAEVTPLDPGEAVDVMFGNLGTTAITRFLVLTAVAADRTTRNALVVADLTGDPADRLDRVLAEQIDTPEKFLQFLALLLGLGDSGTRALLGEGEGPSSAWWPSRGNGILELLLAALAERPAQLDDLARLVTRLASTEQGRAVLPGGFLELWDIVDQARRSIIGGSV